MFDTHCHLNFKAFEGRVEEVIDNAKKAGINSIVVPGTDLESSKKAVEISERFDQVYAAVGIHPHHVFEIQSNNDSGQAGMTKEMQEIEKLLTHKKVVAIGEIGLDRHYYNKTKYPDYKIDESFLELQKDFLRKQIELAIKYKKSIIFHNREARKDFLETLTDYRSLITDYRCVFHCCEPDQALLEYAIRHKIFIGVDGDITYRKDKQEFIKTVPLKMLVLETDSPLLLPIQLRGDNKRRPANEPKNLKLIADFIAEIIGIKVETLEKITVENSGKLFKIV
ncbi:hypothetical protein A2767_07510 [Candidatus Roizmanbacteria bacterium RIFCSPHIGHO2_01_FULL_35_10]|uniref:Hydrolase TatD n=1 Tax=Candidatus Roizmanbacteria bacterium RIFCSPLOWO2_01_FULL_35_13 TaxID=1802055 RepID=A0A1F7ICN7_9BACT|nr:MAG: hypothetical protein A2767_07510 [Candidatus Roizmanbacteria bacterium RIFCSPHIGHO2_01_FULL_35_10]OGK41116.1 MAG: hypothetical protein A3A74_02110 [Candidatus Roizmanbacteria bacterium RIFCSPLOWO2_01_FULL_35_13]